MGSQLLEVVIPPVGMYRSAQAGQAAIEAAIEGDWDRAAGHLTARLRQNWFTEDLGIGMDVGRHYLRGDEDAMIRTMKEHAPGQIAIGAIAYFDVAEDIWSQAAAGDFRKAGDAYMAASVSLGREMLPLDFYYQHIFGAQLSLMAGGSVPVSGQDFIAFMDWAESLDPAAARKGRAAAPFVGFVVDVALTVATLPIGGTGGAIAKGARTGLTATRPLLAQGIKSALVTGARTLSDDALRGASAAGRAGWFQTVVSGLGTATRQAGRPLAATAKAAGQLAYSGVVGIGRLGAAALRGTWRGIVVGANFAHGFVEGVARPSTLFARLDVGVFEGLLGGTRRAKLSIMELAGIPGFRNPRTGNLRIKLGTSGGDFAVDRAWHYFRQGLLDRVEHAVGQVAARPQISQLVDRTFALPSEEDYKWSQDNELGWVFGGEYPCYSLRNRDHSGGTEGRFPFADWSLVVEQLPPLGNATQPT